MTHYLPVLKRLTLALHTLGFPIIIAPFPTSTFKVSPENMPGNYTIEVRYYTADGQGAIVLQHTLDDGYTRDSAGVGFFSNGQLALMDEHGCASTQRFFIDVETNTHAMMSAAGIPFFFSTLLERIFDAILMAETSAAA